MSVDIFGFASTNAQPARPSDARSFGTTGDTYAKDCTTPSSQDGTQILAGWYNQVAGTLRSLVRGNGLKANGVDPVVVYDQGDDMALRAVEQMIQRGRLTFGVDSGSAGNIVVNLPVTPAELLVGMRVAVQVAAAPNGPATLTLSGFPSQAVVRRGGVALIGGEWSASDIVEFRLTAAGWQLSGIVMSDFTIASAVTKVIGTDFPSLAAAFAWVSQYSITSTGSVTFVLPAGQTTLTQNLSISHPQGRRISVVGAAMLGAVPNQAAFQVTGPSAAQRAADRAANLTLCRARYGSEILLAGGVTIYIVGQFGGFTNVLFTGDGTVTTNGGDIISLPDGQTLFSNCVVNGGAGRGFVVGGAGSLTTVGCFAFGNAGNGFSAEEGGKIILTAAPGSFGNGGHGFLASGGACLLVDQTVPSSLMARGNGGCGIQASLGASIPTIGPAATLSNNGVYGAGASQNGTACADNATAGGNGSTAFAASSGGTMSAQNTAGGGNGGYGYSASGVGLVIATGGGATGSSGSLSPAANTVGNGNAYIYQ